jgi:hypothetical protein
LGIILCSDLSLADQVNYTVKKAWKALHFTMRIPKKGNGNTKSLAYTSLVRPIVEYGAACWDSYRKGQVNALDRVQNVAAKFAHHRNYSNWETLTRRRDSSHICSLQSVHGERGWNAIGDILQRPCYLNRVDHNRKIRSRKQKTDIEKYYFVRVYRTTQLWNQLPEDVLGTLSCKSSNFRKRVKKVTNKG